MKQGKLKRAGLRRDRENMNSSRSRHSRHGLMLSAAGRMTILILTTLGLAACEEKAPEVVKQVRAIKTFTVIEVASGQLRKFSGIVQATDSSSLSFQVGGNVRKVNVKLGDRVVKGKVLAVLDRKPFQLDVQAASAELDKARAIFKQKKLELNRQKQLYAKGWVAKARVDQVVRAYESAVGQVNYAVSKLNLAKRDLANTVLRAPFKGVIAGKHVDPFVEVRAGQKLFDIDAEGAMEVAFDVPETTISRIAIGMPVTAAFRTKRGCVCKGRITEVGSVAGKANSYPAKASLIDLPPAIRSGMTVEVSILLKVDAETAAYLIPFAALAPAEKTREGFVFVYDPKTQVVRRTLVKARGATNNMVQIYEGINAGDVIAVAGVSFLTDGQKVKLMNP